MTTSEHKRKAERFKSGQRVTWTFPQETKLGGAVITKAGKPRAAVVMHKAEYPGWWGLHGWILIVAGEEHPCLASDEEITEESP